MPEEWDFRTYLNEHTLNVLAAHYADAADAATDEGRHDTALFLDTMSYRIREGRSVS